MINKLLTTRRILEYGGTLDDDRYAQYNALAGDSIGYDFSNFDDEVAITPETGDPSDWASRFVPTALSIALGVRGLRRGLSGKGFYGITREAANKKYNVIKELHSGGGSNAAKRWAKINADRLGRKTTGLLLNGLGERATNGAASLYGKRAKAATEAYQKRLKALSSSPPAVSHNNGGPLDPSWSLSNYFVNRNIATGQLMPHAFRKDFDLMQGAGDYLTNSANIASSSSRLISSLGNSLDDVIQEQGGAEGATYATGSAGDKSSYLRYAPAVMSGISYLGDLFGANRPDYREANKIEAMSKGFRNIAYSPIASRMTPRYFDREYHANKLANQANSQRAVILASASGNASNSQGALLAHGLNASTGLGNLYRQAEEFNTTREEQAFKTNVGIEGTNKQMQMQADAQSNASHAQRMNALITAANMRAREDQMSSTVRSNNLTNFTNSLAGIGLEAYRRNALDSMYRRYKTKLDGSVEYIKELERQKKNS